MVIHLRYQALQNHSYEGRETQVEGTYWEQSAELFPPGHRGKNNEGVFGVSTENY